MELGRRPVATRAHGHALLTRIPWPLSWICRNFSPPPFAVMVMFVAPASSEFSSISLTALAGRCTTSPAAIRFTTSCESRRMEGAPALEAAAIASCKKPRWVAPPSLPLCHRRATTTAPSSRTANKQIFGPQSNNSSAVKSTTSSLLRCPGACSEPLSHSADRRASGCRASPRWRHPGSAARVSRHTHLLKRALPC